jgi:hypothetical protein
MMPSLIGTGTETLSAEPAATENQLLPPGFLVQFGQPFVPQTWTSFTPKSTRRGNVLATLNWAKIAPEEPLVSPTKWKDRLPAGGRGSGRTAQTMSNRRPSPRPVNTAMCLAVMPNYIITRKGALVCRHCWTNCEFFPSLNIIRRAYDQETWVSRQFQHWPRTR